MQRYTDGSQGTGWLKIGSLFSIRLRFRCPVSIDMCWFIGRPGRGSRKVK